MPCLPYCQATSEHTRVNVLYALQGEYTVVLVAGGTAEEQLLCLQVDFDVTPPFTGRAKQSLRRAATKLGVLKRRHSEDGESARTARAHT